MKKQTSSTLLILASILGFILIAAGLGLTLVLDQIYYLALLALGIIISIGSLALSARSPQTSTHPEEDVEYEDTLDIIQKDVHEVAEEPELEEVVEAVEQVEEPVEEVETEEPIKAIEPLDLKKYTIELDIDSKTSESLLRLTEKMIEHNLLAYNPTYEEENTSNSDIFKEAFKAIPVVGVVKNRFNNYNILAGITHDDVEIIGTIKEQNLELVQTIHPKTQNIRGMITGGKFKTPENTEHTQAHRVQVTFYV